MKKLTVSLCVCLALAVFPLASQAADHPRLERLEGIISSAVVGGTAGLLVGCLVAVGAESTSGGPPMAGLVIGASLGALYAIMNPAPAEASPPSAAATPEQGKATVYPPGTKATPPTILKPAAPADAGQDQ
jgi:hypothetical protein